MPNSLVEISFRLAEFACKLQDPVKIYINEKQKLLNRYADRDLDGNIIVQDGKYIITNKQQEFTEAYKKLIGMEIDIEKPTIQLGPWAQGRITALDIRELSELIHFTFQGDH